MRGGATTTVEPLIPSGSRASCLVVIGDGTLAVHDLSRELVIGRGGDCDVVVPHRALSRRHAIVRPAPVTIEDLDSTNGTWTGGARIPARTRVPLAAGAFRIGSITFWVLDRTRLGQPASSASELLFRVVDPTLAGATPIVRDIARSGVNVLVLGETGVGKEVLAATLHELSGRRGELIRINCAALSESLLESELFGHEKGAFTGAVAQKPGLLEAADRGTVFLDEIGDMAPATQAKLLRVVEQREVTRLGAVKATRIDVRFLAATHRDLAGDVGAGRFREDLFFRLDGIELVIPPLRERRAAIGRLARELVEAAPPPGDGRAPTISADAIAALEAYDWPGNVRELKAVLERAALLARGSPIDAKHVKLTRRAPPPRTERLAPSHAGVELTAHQLVDRDRLLRALEECVGNQSRAAKLLGISRTTMVTKLGLYRIKRPRS